MPYSRRTSRRRTSRRTRQPREYRQTGVLGRLIITLAVVAAIVLGVAIFFRVQKVDVQGNTIYSKEQVEQASGIELGDNLLMVNRPAVTGRIQARMPYVQEVSVGRILPDTIVILVKESDLAAQVSTDIGGICYLNTNGRVLGDTLTGFQGQVIQLTGFTVSSPKIGEQAVAAEDQSENLNAALEVLRGMEGSGVMEQITEIDGSKIYDLVVNIGDRLEILLGGTEKMEYKIQYLQAILDSLQD